MGFSFRLTILSLISWVGTMKLLPMYLFLTKTGLKGIPDAFEKPIAAGTPESGTPITISASTGDYSQIFIPDFSLTS